MGEGLSWPSLYSFIRYLPYGALEEDRDMRSWYQGAHIPDLLALLVDYAAAYLTNGQAKPIDTPPRNRQRKQNAEHIGEDAIPASDFMSWWDKE